MRIRLALVAFVLLSAVPASAGPSTFVFRQDFQQVSSWIEQQSQPQFPDCTLTTCVHRPLPPEPPLNCHWDVDDWGRVEGFGTLPKLTSASGSTCVVADGYDHGHSPPGSPYWGQGDHRISVKVFAPRPDMTVTLSNSQGLSWNIPATPNGNGYAWLFCMYDMTGQPNPPSWYPVIPGTNGGTGIPVTYTLTLTAGSRDVRDVFAYFIDGSEGNTHWECP